MVNNSINIMNMWQVQLVVIADDGLLLLYS